jgi:hypothetical protein
MQEANASPYGAREGGFISQDPNPTVVNVSLAPDPGPVERTPTPIGPIDTPASEAFPGFTVVNNVALGSDDMDGRLSSREAGQEFNSAFSPDPSFAHSAALQSFAAEAPESSGFMGGFANNPGWSWGVDPGPVFEGSVPAAVASSNAFAPDPGFSQTPSGYDDAGREGSRGNAFGSIGFSVTADPGLEQGGNGYGLGREGERGSAFGALGSVNAFGLETAPSFSPDPGFSQAPGGYEFGREAERGLGFSGIGVNTEGASARSGSPGLAVTVDQGNVFGGGQGGGGFERGSGFGGRSQGETSSQPSFNPGDGSMQWGDGTITPGPAGRASLDSDDGPGFGGATLASAPAADLNAFDSDREKDKERENADLNAFDPGGFSGFDLGGFDLGGYA